MIEAAAAPPERTTGGRRCAFPPYGVLDTRRPMGISYCGYKLSSLTICSQKGKNQCRKRSHNDE
jgi:hypothetical protein